MDLTKRSRADLIHLITISESLVRHPCTLLAATRLPPAVTQPWWSLAMEAPIAYRIFWMLLILSASSVGGVETPFEDLQVSGPDDGLVAMDDTDYPSPVHTDNGLEKALADQIVKAQQTSQGARSVIGAAGGQRKAPNHKPLKRVKEPMEGTKNVGEAVAPSKSSTGTPSHTLLLPPSLPP